jgi:cell division protein FtsL
MIKMGERKLVNRNIVLALAVVCLVLVIGLAFAVTDYTSIFSSKESQIATQNSQIANLQSQITNLTAPNLVWSHFGVTIIVGRLTY